MNCVREFIRSDELDSIYRGILFLETMVGLGYNELQLRE